MCVWYYAESKSLSYFISKAQQLPLAHEMMVTLARSMAMSGNIRPTDMAAVLAPNKQGNMAVFPMIWGFTHEATEKPIVNCRVESADQKAMHNELPQSRWPRFVRIDYTPMTWIVCAEICNMIRTRAVLFIPFRRISKPSILRRVLFCAVACSSKQRM